MSTVTRFQKTTLTLALSLSLLGVSTATLAAPSYEPAKPKNPFTLEKQAKLAIDLTKTLVDGGVDAKDAAQIGFDFMMTASPEEVQDLFRTFGDKAFDDRDLPDDFEYLDDRWDFPYDYDGNEEKLAKSAKKRLDVLRDVLTTPATDASDKKHYTAEERTKLASTLALFDEYKNAEAEAVSDCLDCRFLKEATYEALETAARTGGAEALKTALVTAAKAGELKPFTNGANADDEITGHDPVAHVVNLVVPAQPAQPDPATGTTDPTATTTDPAATGTGGTGTTTTPPMVPATAGTGTTDPTTTPAIVPATAGAGGAGAATGTGGATAPALPLADTDNVVMLPTASWWTMDSYDERIGGLVAHPDRRLWVRVEGDKQKRKDEAAANTKGLMAQFGVERRLNDVWNGTLFVEGRRDKTTFAVENQSVKLKRFGLGVILTRVEDNRYIDLVGRLARDRYALEQISYDPTGVDVVDATVKGYNLYVSAETGRRFENDRRYFVEPQLQVAYVRQTLKDYTWGDKTVSTDPLWGVTGRVGVKVGAQRPKDVYWVRGDLLARLAGKQTLTVGQANHMDATVSEKNRGIGFALGAGAKHTFNANWALSASAFMTKMPKTKAGVRGQIALERTW